MEYFLQGFSQAYSRGVAFCKQKFTLQRFIGSFLRFSPFFILALQNLIIFFNHYFNGYGFPWDFGKSYYGLTAFWTTAVSSGIFPHWVPFQSMGYPLGMNLQSGLYYPPLWIFPIFHIPYTIANAVRFQCLHILFGSLGMFLFLKLIFKSSKYSLVGAIAFQFFGGFYSNAPHVDIVRAYALTPWLLYASTFKESLKINLKSKKFQIAQRNLLLPLLICLITTGGYPGNFISSLFVIELYIILQALNILFKDPKTYLKTAAIFVSSLSLLLCLGLAMSSIHLGPAWLLKDELVRYASLDAFGKTGLSIEHIPGLFLSNRRLPGDIYTTSSYVALPLFMMLFFIPIAKIKKHWIYVALLVISCLMITSEKSFLFVFLIKIIPPLSLSRFPATDYKIYISVMIITLSIAGLRAIINNEVSKISLAIRTIVVSFVINWGINESVLIYSLDQWQMDFPAMVEAVNSQALIATLSTICMLLVIFCTYHFKLKHFKLKQNLVICIVVFMIIFHSMMVISDIKFCWIDNDLESYYTSLPLMQNNRLVTYDIFERRPQNRPKRLLIKDSDFANFPWQGYLNGKYMTEDYGGSTLKTRELIERNDKYYKFMQLQWQPIIMKANWSENLTNAKIQINDDDLFDPKNYSQSNIQQTYYGIDTIIYDVDLEQDKLMVENESYFRGWEAELVDKQNGEKKKLQSVSVNEAFRGWLLPKGNYEMKATFQIPYWTTFRNISIIAFVLWLILII